MKLPKKILDKINSYYTTCIMKYNYHLKAATKYKTLYVYTTAPIIVFSSITTVLASYNGNNVDANLAIAVAIFSGLTTIGQALISFVEYNTKYASHFAVSNKFINLARMIESEISINYLNTDDVDEDEDKKKEYIKYLFDKIYAEFTTIQDLEPYLPTILSNVDYNALVASYNKDVGVLLPELTPLIEQP